MKRICAAAFLLPTALLGGCDLLPTEVNLPIPLNTPAVDIDVGAAVEEGVTSSCSSPDSASCQSIGLICQAETGAACDPVDLPAQFPAEIDVDGTPTSAEDVLPTELKDAARIQLAIPVDLAAALADGGVSSPEQVKSISFDSVFITWDENSLTFDAPVLDVYVGPVTDDTSDPAALIASADFARVGSVGLDTDPDAEGLEVGQLAETTGQVPLNFIAGGNDIFNERLTSFAFTLVLMAPEGQAVTLKAVDGDASKVRKPDGAASIKLESTLNYTVDLAAATGVDSAL